MSGVEDGELKAGHLPAVKAGGMRITQHKLPKEEREVVKPSKESEETKPSTSPPKTLFISGFPTKGNADFPTEAVKNFHEKPLPTHDAPRSNTNNTKAMFIQQPRK